VSNMAKSLEFQGVMQLTGAAKSLKNQKLGLVAPFFA